MTPALPALKLQFRRTSNTLIPIDQQALEMFQLAKFAGAWAPGLDRWFLSSDKSKDEALLYEAFDTNGPTAAAMAVWRERNKGVTDIRSLSIWNGAEKSSDSASISSTTSALGRPDSVGLQLKLNPAVTDWHKGCELIRAATAIWPALFATFSPFWHSEKQVFKDRPGVGWMLYLPHALTVQQVPEARALVPVMGKDEKGRDKQIGTIVVSVTDEPFSDENPEHVKIANAIEIRLADQDLLPRYADL